MESYYYNQRTWISSVVDDENINHDHHSLAISKQQLLQQQQQQQKEMMMRKRGGNRRGGGTKLSTDPQSVAARQRRHRISDRFKILKSLVPGGSKMDTVSMLEEAIHYVKYLKSQIWLHKAEMTLPSDEQLVSTTTDQFNGATTAAVAMSAYGATTSTAASASSSDFSPAELENQRTDQYAMANEPMLSPLPPLPPCSFLGQDEVFPAPGSFPYYYSYY